MLFSQIIPPSASPTEGTSLFFTYVSLFFCLTYRVIVTIFLNSIYIWNIYVCVCVCVCVNIPYWCFSFWFTSFCIIGSSFILLIQFSSVAQSCPTLCDPMNHSTPGLPVHRQLQEFPQTHVHQIGDAIQPSHPRSCPSPPASNPCQHQSLFQWVNSLHEVAKVLKFQL